MRKWIAIVTIFLLAVAGLYAFFSYGIGADDENGQIERSGIIKPVELKLGSQIYGEVSAVRAAEGSRIKKEDTVIQLDDTLLKDQLVAAAASVETAKVTLAAATTDSVRNIAKAQLKQAESELSVAQTQYALTVIQSPVDGVVKSISFSKGEAVSPSATIAVIAKTSELELNIYANEKDLIGFSTGQEIDVAVNKYSGVVFEGRIVDISSDPTIKAWGAQTAEQLSNPIYHVKIRINNPEKKLEPGMFAEAIFDRHQK
jgi:HlyD family secretion protein